MSRNATAALIGVLGFLVYVAVVVTLGDHLIGRHWALQALYYLVAGFAWTWPALWLIRWAVRPEGRRD